MKKIQQITSVFLVLFIINTFVGKTIHELFFHHEGVHCDAKTEKHFHHVEYEQEDLVCTFNFSTSHEASSINHHFFNFLNEKIIISEYLTIFIKKYINKNNPLRGPPTT